MKNSKMIRLFLWLGGSVPFIIGVAHLFLPTWGFDPKVIGEFPPEVRAHFVDLSLYAIASFLLAFAALSFYFAMATITRATFVFNIIMFFVWGIRTILEILFPVELALFGVANPSVQILVVTTLTSVFYLLNIVMMSRQKFD